MACPLGRRLFTDRFWSARRPPPTRAFEAAFKGQLEELKATLAVKVDINACDAARRTMLYSACRGCTGVDATESPAVVEFLLRERHANPLEPSTGSNSYPQHAALASWNECVQAGRADDSAANRAVNILRLLQKNGGNFDAKNGCGLTALEELDSYGTRLTQHPLTARIRAVLLAADVATTVVAMAENEAQDGDAQVRFTNFRQSPPQRTTHVVSNLA